jgi:hypothetical protein
MTQSLHPLLRRQSDREEQAVRDLEAQIKTMAHTLGFSITEFTISKSMIDARGWTTINIRMTQVPPGSRGKLVEGS